MRTDPFDGGRQWSSLSSPEKFWAIAFFVLSLVPICVCYLVGGLAAWAYVAYWTGWRNSQALMRRLIGA